MKTGYQSTTATALAALGLGLALGGAAQAQEAGFDLDALIEAARAEPPITVYAVTGKIVATAEAFTARYGVEAYGKKVSEADQIDLLIREFQRLYGRQIRAWVGKTMPWEELSKIADRKVLLDTVQAAVFSLDPSPRPRRPAKASISERY